jgi:hypothetical protein
MLPCRRAFALSPANDVAVGLGTDAAVVLAMDAATASPDLAIKAVDVSVGCALRTPLPARGTTRLRALQQFCKRDPLTSLRRGCTLYWNALSEAPAGRATGRM